MCELETWIIDLCHKKCCKDVQGMQGVSHSLEIKRCIQPGKFIKDGCSSRMPAIYLEREWVEYCRPYRFKLLHVSQKKVESTCLETRTRRKLGF